jgi:hypothetical protein
LPGGKTGNDLIDVRGEDAFNGGVTAISCKEEHHRALSSRDELLAMLERTGVDYDPAYFD